MTQTEIRDFKKFMNDQNAYMVFEKYYNENRMTFNPKRLDDYLERTRADIVIPQAFIYPKGIYGKDFWLALNRAQRGGATEWSRPGSDRGSDEEYLYGTAEGYLFAESSGRQSIDAEHGTLEDGGQETLHSHAGDPQPEDQGRGADVQPTAGHRGEVQTGIERTGVQ